MSFSSKYGAPVRTVPSPPTDALTDHEIALQMKLFSDNETRLGCAARRIRTSTGDWPWVWLKDIVPKPWSSAIIEEIGTLMPHGDLDEVKAFFHDAVKQRSGNALTFGDVERARRHFGFDDGSQVGNNNNSTPNNDGQHDDEHKEGFFSYKDDAASGKGKSTKRRRLHCDSEFEVEDDTASLISAVSISPCHLTIHH